MAVNSARYMAISKYIFEDLFEKQIALQELLHVFYLSFSKMKLESKLWQFSCKNIHSKMSSAKCWPFVQGPINAWSVILALTTMYWKLAWRIHLIVSLRLDRIAIVCLQNTREGMCLWYQPLKHGALGPDNMAAILQTTFSDAFYLMKMYG